MNTPIIEVTKEFNVPAEMVYDAWLDPNAIIEFMKPADVVTVPQPQIDARVGGGFLFEMHLGDNILPHKGEYKVLDRAQKIQFSWNSMNTNHEDSIVTISIKTLTEKSCHLTLTHELLPSEESRKDHRNGWTNILEHLQKFSLR